MVKYGKTWWGDNWLDALKGIDFTNRIPRGKSYANTEKVYDVKINGNIVLAKVKGNYAHHYNVQVSFKEFTTSEKKKIAEIINKSPSILSALLNHKLPEGLYYALSDENIELFPNSW